MNIESKLKQIEKLGIKALGENATVELKEWTPDLWKVNVFLPTEHIERPEIVVWYPDKEKAIQAILAALKVLVKE